MNNRFIVIKFGGTSVSTRQSWQNIVTIIKRHIQTGFKPIVVCSAITQITNFLEQLISAALLNGETQATQEILNQIQLRYKMLAQDLDLDFDALLKNDFEILSHYIKGIALLSEASPKIQARVLSFGELLLTKLGAAFLQNNGLAIAWQDAREILVAEKNNFATIPDHYLSATCEIKYNIEIAKKLAKLSVGIITQGFVASDNKGETVLLGRGGSDTSAAYFAALVNAQCCEIWTDVPGIYTANPKEVPNARLLLQLDYAEAQEIASMGAKVIHPNSIEPLKIQKIPLYIRYTEQIDLPGTLISDTSDHNGIQIKAIVNKFNVLLINIETVRMWKQVGFLADVFALFKEQGISIDLISTSETSITVSVDNNDAKRNQTALDNLLMQLNKIAKAKIIGPCASISLVGHHIRMILHKISSVFDLFESQQIYLLSQSANDLNLTLVVDEDRAVYLTKKLHALLIEQHPRNHFLGQSWNELFGAKEPEVLTWWKIKRDQLLAIASTSGPLYVYDQATITEAANQLKNCSAINQLFYAIKANSNPAILKILYDLNIGFECTSIYEVRHILALFPEINHKRILFTPNFAPKSEYEAALTLNINITLDNLFILKAWAAIFSGQEILLRIDPGYGAGHHKFVCTGGEESKFGIFISDLKEAADLINKNNITVIGLHAHTGSGILQPTIWQENALKLLSVGHYFPSAKILNIGGGLGIVETPGQTALDLMTFNQSLQKVKNAHPDIQLWLEPGRFLVARAGVLLAKVSQIKQKNETHFIGIEAGMNSLIRPALYGAYHEIVNLTRLAENKNQIAHVVGPICESGDVLGYSRRLPESFEGDIFLIANTGAYGRSMSSRYNLREPADEVLI